MAIASAGSRPLPGSNGRLVLHADWLNFAVLGSLMGTLIVQLGACSLGECTSKEGCCTTCTNTMVRYACDCNVEETPAYFCPKRSACALSYYVGDEPASCCRGGCDSSDIYEQEDGHCDGDDRYLHECAADSPCFQSHRARVLGTRYVPWVTQASGTAVVLTGVWSNTNGDVWVVGTKGRILRRDSITTAWQTVQSPTSENLTGVWGSAPDVVWAVGWHGIILRYDGDAWKTIDSPIATHLFAVWGASASEVWAVGDSGTMLRYDAAEQRWAVETSPVQTRLRAIGGDADGDIFAVGDEGVVLLRDGTSWVIEEAPSDVHLMAVWGTNERFWAVGSAGNLLRREQGVWREQPRITLADLMGGTGDGVQGWAVGQGGAIIVQEAGQWAPVTYFASPPVDLLAVWADASHAIAVGVAGTILSYERTAGGAP